MATFISPSPHSDDDQIPTATLALPSTIPTATPSRRLPPPCWSPDETLALIQSYQHKWYSLRRGNLRANHWQEVADQVSILSPAPLPKTAVQCRHKMEKLRKRYRNELSRAASHGGLRNYSSSWVHFLTMHHMEQGPPSSNPNPKIPTPPSTSSSDDDDLANINTYHNNNNRQQQQIVYPGGVRIKMPNINPNPNTNTSYYAPRFPNSVAIPNNNGNNKMMMMMSSSGNGNGNNRRRVEVPETKKREEREGGGGMGEIVAAIQAMGEGFMRIEKVKMDMMRQVEEMRMEMELKRTQMILESQQRIVDAFAKAVTERSSRKRARRAADEEEENGNENAIGS